MEDIEIDENLNRKKRHLSNDSDTGDNIVSDLVYKKQKLDEVGGNGNTINEIRNYNSFPKSSLAPIPLLGSVDKMQGKFSQLGNQIQSMAMDNKDQFKEVVIEEKVKWINGQ